MTRKRVIKPYISEKSTTLMNEENVYVFVVERDVNKKEIKNEVEKGHNVNVEDVRIVKIPAKKRRLGRTEGIKKGFKKALVKVKKGQKIEIFSS